MSWRLSAFDKEYAINHETRIPCVLIAGWSVDCAVFEWLLPALAQDFRVYTADIDDYTAFADTTQLVDRLNDTLQAELENPAWVLGWSMGGNIALDLAHRHPETVAGLILNATNLSFVERPHWPAGMPMKTFDTFCSNVQKNPRKTLQRFDLLQSKGDDEQADLVQSLARYREEQHTPAAEQLVHGLQLLGEFDQVADVSAINKPMLFCFGEADALVNADAARATAALLPKAHVHCFPDTAHLPFLTRTDDFFDAFDALLDAEEHRHTKQKVAESFSRAAVSYDGASQVQQLIAEELLAHCPQNPQARVLDAGCGTGVWTEALGKKAGAVYGLDIARGMLQYAHGEHSAVDGWLCGDLEQLPLADNSVDVIFSSLAVQWSDSLVAMMNDWYRVLKPGGIALVATLGPRTLHELRESFSHADSYQHVNEFLPRQTVVEQIGETGLTIDWLENDSKVMRYNTMRDLLRDLKNIGAHTVVKGGVAGLMGRQRFRKAEQAYQTFALEDGSLPATYDVITLRLSK